MGWPSSPESGSEGQIEKEIKTAPLPDFWACWFRVNYFAYNFIKISPGAAHDSSDGDHAVRETLQRALLSLATPSSL